jgi:hypothetical protein
MSNKAAVLTSEGGVVHSLLDSTVAAVQYVHNPKILTCHPTSIGQVLMWQHQSDVSEMSERSS